MQYLLEAQLALYYLLRIAEEVIRVWCISTQVFFRWKHRFEYRQRLVTFSGLGYGCLVIGSLLFNELICIYIGINYMKKMHPNGRPIKKSCCSWYIVGSEKIASSHFLGQFGFPGKILKRLNIKLSFKTCWMVQIN